MPVNAVAFAAVVVAAEEEFDPNDVTPGIEGFVLTFLVMAVVVLLVLDMVRRIRRVNYRAEVREQLEAEQAAAAADGVAGSGAGGAGESGASSAPPGEADAAASDRPTPEERAQRVTGATAHVRVTAGAVCRWGVDG